MPNNMIQEIEELNKAIADLMDTNIGTVKSRLFNVKALLKSILVSKLL